MKFLRYIAAATISACAFLLQEVHACGPFPYEVPEPTFFRLCHADAAESRMAENIRLWQSQTSQKISAADIREVVYGDTDPDVWHDYWTDVLEWHLSGYSERTDNTFLNYLNNAGDDEAANCLMLAKHVARLRADRNSPWYYPASKKDVKSGFDPVIATIERYQGKRFYNRYSLQLVRALFASARYDECIAAFNSRFGGVSDNDLMKSMARDYAAGAACRLGNKELAADYFAAVGDIASLKRYIMSEDSAFDVSVRTCPDSSKLMQFIERKINGIDQLYIDSTFVRTKILPAARRVLSGKKTRNKALWHYIAAVCEGQFNGNVAAAYWHIRRASAPQSAVSNDNIRAYRMLLEARMGMETNLLSDLRWLEGKITDLTSPDYRYWRRVMEHIVLGHLVPHFAGKGDMITAIQMANYGENMPGKDMETIYSNTFFVFMQNQAPETIEQYIASLSSQEPLHRFLNAGGYTDRNYLLDLAGTLYIRHRDYANAVRVLAKVAPSYQNRLNVARREYLNRNPFLYQAEGRYTVSKDNLPNKKLYFAREMLRLENEFNSSEDNNRRGLARLKYAIGLDNSFNGCWALTSYHLGDWVVAENEDFERFYTPENTQDYARAKATSDSKAMIAQALGEITGAESAAQAHYMLYNYRTVAQRYPGTKIGRMMAAQCDAWSDWVAQRR